MAVALPLLPLLPLLLLLLLMSCAPPRCSVRDSPCCRAFHRCQVLHGCVGCRR
jgi:hypothetical protein